MALNQVTLGDKYDLTKSRIFVTGFQAIVRLCLMQKERDRRAGLNTAGYVTGYRGSPLGGYDLLFSVCYLSSVGQTLAQPAGLDAFPPGQEARPGQVYIGRYPDNFRCVGRHACKYKNFGA